MPRRVYPNLAAFLREHDGTAHELARELGISPPLLSMIKWRVRQPRLELALKIAERCNVPLESLLLPKPHRKAS